MAKNAKQYLIDKSLWYRNVKDFIYTVKVFETVLDSSKLSRFFQDTKDISIDQLYDARGRIKPAGSPDTANDLSTIFGTVESWSGPDGKNDRKPIKRTSKVQLSRKQKEQIKKDSQKAHIEFLSDIKSPREGQIVFVYGQNPPRNKQYAIDVNDPTSGFYEYSRGEWLKIEDAYQ